MNALSYNLHRLEILRYEMLPRPHPHSIGYSGLRLVLPRRAVDHELDTVFLSIVDWRGRPQSIRIHQNATPNSETAVAPGRIYVSSHDETEGAFYTYGGRLAVDRLPEGTVVTITSEAPLLELCLRQEALANLLVAETEALLGRLEAEEHLDYARLVAGLTAVGSLGFYLAVVRSLLDQYKGDGALHQMHHELIGALESERDWYQAAGQWLPEQPDLRRLADQVSASTSSMRPRPPSTSDTPGPT